MTATRLLRLVIVPVVYLALASCAQLPSAEDRIVQLLAADAPYHVISPRLFAQLGWDLPDGGATVTELAKEAPGGAFDPRTLASLPAEKLGYTARWHETRFRVYGLDWDIGALHLLPKNAVAGLPTMIIINGGAANWYEFFIGPKNAAGLAQYLAQRIPVVLVTIPGNYRHGGWTETDVGERIPGYLLDRDVPADEAKIRNTIYTFRVVTDGIKAVIDEIVTGPAVIIGHSTGGEVQFILKEPLAGMNLGLSMGWGTGGPAGMHAMRDFRGVRSIDDYPHISQLRARTPDQYSGGYLGPLNPYWDKDKSRLEMAEEWMGAEQRRRAQFKQPLQDMEHSSALNLQPEIAAQIRQTLADNSLGVDADEVIADLFSTMRSPITGYKKMIWATAPLDTGHWNEDLTAARELIVANEFRAANPGVPIRVLLFGVPMTHYGHVEKPRELAGGLFAALRWLAQH
ncbi:MAG: carboxylesterase family protein [Gammaproteobacteria bacterium]|nr:carboxylesterase family protein [Gammaproteobacteria bacterium]MDH3433011.1 carboxylesterase family protein [Gammaproteobacteria bacterium]